MDKSEGFLLAIGEIFLKSEGVQKLLMQRLINNISFFLDKKNSCRDIKVEKIIWMVRALGYTVRCPENEFRYPSRFSF